MAIRVGRDRFNKIISLCRFIVPADPYNDERSLDLFDVQETFVSVPIGLWKEFGTFKEPEFSLFKTDLVLPPLRDYQKPIFQKLIQQLETNRSTQLILRTGWGKTTISAHLIQHYKMKPLIISYLDIVRNQWKKLLGEEAVVASPFVFKEEMLDCGLVIVDEIHQCTEAIFNLLLKLNPAFLVGLTATPERRDGLSDRFPLFFGEEIRTSSGIVIEEILVEKIKTKFSPPIKTRTVKGEKVIDWNFIVNYLSKNEERMKTVVEIALSQKPIDGTILIFNPRIKEAEAIYEILFEMEEDVYLLTGSRPPPIDSFKFIVTTYNKSGTGYDNRDLSVVILNGSRTDVRQFVGRLRGSRKKIIDIVDNCRIIENHWLKRLSYYKEEGAIIKERK